MQWKTFYFYMYMYQLLKSILPSIYYLTVLTKLLPSCFKTSINSMSQSFSLHVVYKYLHKRHMVLVSIRKRFCK